MNPFPHDPQPPDVLAARYREAVAHTFDKRLIDLGIVSPAINPANRFDWPDGLRLVVNRERDGE
jgi:hypothetical protein